MLAPAKDYEYDIKIECIFIRDLPEYKYYPFGAGGYINLRNSPDYHEFVSVSDDTIYGFFRYRIENNCATDFEIIKFKNSLVFSKDLMILLKDIFEVHEFQKLSFNVHEKNSIAQSDKEIIYRYGGRKIGSRDNYDFYEITIQDYYKNKGAKE